MKWSIALVGLIACLCLPASAAAGRAESGHATAGRPAQERTVLGRAAQQRTAVGRAAAGHATTGRAAQSGGQSVRLGASFTPYRLGGRTTIGFDFQIAAPAGEIPSALTDVDIRYPEGLGIVLSGLGLEICSQAMLEAIGAEGCPANSIMGYGSATAEMRFGAQLVSESARISIARAPDEEGHIALLLYAVGPSPVDTQILSPAALVPAAAPFGGQLNIQLPLVGSVPGAPDVAIVQMHATIGPLGVTYYEHAAGNTLAYTPRGILLPRTCPRGGFRFAATFGFLDGSHPSARASVPCPAASRHAATSPSALAGVDTEEQTTVDTEAHMATEMQTTF